MANANANDLGPNPESKKMNKTIPEDLAGYQNIVYGNVQENDILVTHDFRDKVFVTPNLIGLYINPAIQDYDIYRKMPCPKVGDHDKDCREAKVSAGLWSPDKAKTDDGDKPPLSNLPWKALREVSKVQAYGHKKYGDYHNYKKGMEVSRQLSCAVRHIADYMDGIDLDEESGVSHLAHAATRLLFALENIEEGKAIDDRYKQP